MGAQDPDAPIVQLLYTDEWVLWDGGVPGRGGYLARITGFVDQGEGRTVDQAIKRLAAALRDYVEAWDAEVDEYARARRVLDRLNHFEEPALVSWTRAALRCGRLEQLLHEYSEPPVFAGPDPEALIPLE